ncbi:30S ribosomal protein S20 [Patescibacteria group bacterium]|nr:30S ribosomal protein S20 [Patescibacteria group bacterium]
MPVTKSAKKALRTATRRHSENLLQKAAFKNAMKNAKRAVAAGGKEVAEALSQVQSTLDKAAKKHTIHPNKAARLKSRLAKLAASTPAESTPKKSKPTKSSGTTKKKVAAKTKKQS